jgi:nitroimidazol reductase NimA-like FMN-containing flavoprotein (pyridoxamine 5'-phosphate oxidase superfamily)
MQAPLDSDEIEGLLASERVVRLCFGGSESHYLLPVGYVWFDGALNLMLSEGKKTALLRDNPRVAFQVDDSSTAGVTNWRSVSGEALAAIVTDGEIRQRIGAALLARFPELRAWGEAEASSKDSAASLLFVRLVPSMMTGRRFSI